MSVKKIVEEAGLAAAPLSRSEGGMLFAELRRRRPEVGSKVSPACGRYDPRPSLSPIAPPQLSQVVAGNYLDRNGWDLDGLRCAAPADGDPSPLRWALRSLRHRLTAVLLLRLLRVILEA